MGRVKWQVAPARAHLSFLPRRWLACRARGAPAQGPAQRRLGPFARADVLRQLVEQPVVDHQEQGKGQRDGQCLVDRDGQCVVEARLEEIVPRRHRQVRHDPRDRNHGVGAERQRRQRPAQPGRAPAMLPPKRQQHQGAQGVTDDRAAQDGFCVEPVHSFGPGRPDSVGTTGADPKSQRGPWGLAGRITCSGGIGRGNASRRRG